jgi:hypothetical protein
VTLHLKPVEALGTRNATSRPEPDPQRSTTLATGRHVTRRQARAFAVAISLVSLQLAIAGVADLSA